MKILQLCHKVPYPPVDGGSIAMNNLTQGLIQAGNKVKVLAIATSKHPFMPQQIPFQYTDTTNIEAVWINTAVNPMHAFLNLFSSASYNIQRFYSKRFEQKLEETFMHTAFDIIQLESLFVSPYLECIRKNSKAKIILRSHNVEYTIWERLALAAANPFKKYYLNLLASRLKKYEVNTLKHLDGIAAITAEDAVLFRKLGYKKPLIHIPFGVTTGDYPVSTKQQVNPPCLFHIGSMDWLPNQQALTWFLEQVWEQLHQTRPDLKLYLAGKNILSWKQSLNVNLESKNITVVPEVDDAIQFMQNKSIMIVPLHSGGGMRVKIIEAMALGKTVISTSIGAEGILYEDEKNILIADTPELFIKKIGYCLSEPISCNLIGQNARLLVQQNYDNSSLCQKLTAFYREILN